MLNFDERAENMKSCRLLLVCILATTSAGAANSDVHMHSSRASFLRHSANPSAIDFSAQAALHSSMLPLTTDALLGPAAARASFSHLSGDVLRDVQATSAFAQAKARVHDSRLIVLAAFGMVFLQLRRKHNSLPQRRIAAYG
jgi:hypothetical protein